MINDLKQEAEMVKRVGEQIGYGNTMMIASALWVQHLIDNGLDETSAMLGAFYPACLGSLKKTNMKWAMEEMQRYRNLIKARSD